MLSLRRVIAWILLGLIPLLAACGTPLQKVSGLDVISARFCDETQTFDAKAQSAMLRLAALIRSRVEASGQPVAVISRSGVDLTRLGITFTHSGVLMARGGEVPWAVRQLYYACDQGRPYLYDQGLAAFLFGADNPSGTRISILMLPAQASQALSSTALERQTIMSLLADTYTANAHPFSTSYQNCNQWVIELMATAWGSLAHGEDLRVRAQTWLQANDYSPRPVVLDSYFVKFAATLSPMIKLDDHPEADQSGLSFQLSLPRSIETFVRQQWPETQRLELCQQAERVIVRTGWEALDDQCSPDANDERLIL
ncbi:MAG: DUF2145 domain-containing protein [Burkholderiaceae bacterium]